MARLDRFEQHVSRNGAASLKDLVAAIGKQRYDRYWERLDEIKSLLKDAQEDANAIRQLIEQRSVAADIITSRSATASPSVEASLRR
jgi:hypothetical protein